MPNVSLVVPTCRPFEIESFLSHWGQEKYWHQLIVVADAPSDDPRWQETDWGHVATVYYSDCYQRFYEQDSWIFSHQDSACKCFGFLRAVEGGADVVIVLDDDCLPVWADRQPGFVGSFQADHLNALYGSPAWCSTVPNIRPRGLPYGHWGVVSGVEDLLVHMGLWENCPDLDAVQILATTTSGRVLRAGKSVRGFTPPNGIRVMSEHQYWPFCGMHFSFKRRALPILYFPKMGQGSRYSRFDDIWCGMLMQRLFRETGLLASVGEPFVDHGRASDPFVNLRKEAPGIEAHEDYWRVVERMEFSSSDLEECAEEAAAQLRAERDPYLQEWGRGLSVWLQLARLAMRESESSEDRQQPEPIDPAEDYDGRTAMSPIPAPAQSDGLPFSSEAPPS